MNTAAPAPPSRNALTIVLGSVRKARSVSTLQTGQNVRSPATYCAECALARVFISDGRAGGTRGSRIGTEDCQMARTRKRLSG